MKQYAAPLTVIAAVIALAIAVGSRVDLIHAGLAWRYYDPSPEWDKLQAEAKAVRMGLWSDSDAIEPSKWRAGERPKQRELHHDDD